MRFLSCFLSLFRFLLLLAFFLNSLILFLSFSINLLFQPWSKWRNNNRVLIFRLRWQDNNLFPSTAFSTLRSFRRSSCSWLKSQRRHSLLFFQLYDLDFNPGFFFMSLINCFSFVERSLDLSDVILRCSFFAFLLLYFELIVINSYIRFAC